MTENGSNMGRRRPRRQGDLRSAAVVGLTGCQQGPAESQLASKIHTLIDDLVESQPTAMFCEEINGHLGRQ